MSNKPETIEQLVSDLRDYALWPKSYPVYKAPVWLRENVLSDNFNDIADLIEELCIDKNQLPDGIDWPRFEDGSLVRFGDEFIAHEHGQKNPETVTDIGILSPSWLYERYQYDGDKCGFEINGMRLLKLDYPLKRPPTNPPDTQERIDEDALLDYVGYWKCGGWNCTSCPCKLDGKNPRERYNIDSCVKTQKLDLIRRQRELDARTMGDNQ